MVMIVCGFVFLQCGTLPCKVNRKTRYVEESKKNKHVLQDRSMVNGSVDEPEIGHVVGEVK